MDKANLPKNPRQRRLLGLLGELGGSISNLDFQKLLFLYCQEPWAIRLYEFVPYRFGAFSFTSYADKRKLTEQGLLAEDDDFWQLTSNGIAVSVGERDISVKRFANLYGDLRGIPLVAEAYRRYPYYAIRSEIVADVLGDDEEARLSVENAQPRSSPGTLLSIGYEGHSLEAYLNRLLKAGATLLCDVRHSALSRKYGFTKSTLSNACEGVGIRYEHRPQLGISIDRRRNLETSADHLRLFAEYKIRDLPREKETIAETVEWVRSGESVALTCYERDSKKCHRRTVATTIKYQSGIRSSVNHL